MGLRRIHIATVLVLGGGVWTPGAVSQENLRLTLGEVSGVQSRVTDVPLTLTADADVQGLVAVFEWDSELAEGIDLLPTAALANADIVSRRVEPGFAVLGVVVDEDGEGPETIPRAEPDGVTDVAMMQLRCLPGAYEERQTPIRFRDSAHAAVENGPLLDNIVVVGSSA